VDVHSPDSVVASAITKPVPQRVVGLNCSQKLVKEVKLRWQLNSEGDIKRYELFRGPSAQKVKDRRAKLPTDRTEYSDGRLRDGRTYCYKMRAVDKDDLKGAFSDVVCSKTKPLPQKPQGLTTKFENREIILQWQPNPENDILHYRVFKHNFLSWTLLGKTSDVIYRYHGKIKPGEKDTFRLIAVDKDHLASKPSGEVTIQVPK